MTLWIASEIQQETLKPKTVKMPCVKKDFYQLLGGCKMQIMFLVALKSALSRFRCQDFKFQMM